MRLTHLASQQRQMNKAGNRCEKRRSLPVIGVFLYQITTYSLIPSTIQLHLKYTYTWSKKAT